MHSLVNVDDLESLRARLVALCAEDAHQWGSMNAAEAVCHLRGAFLVAMGEIPSEPAHTPIPASMLKAIALWAPMPWKQNFETIPPLKRGGAGMAMTDFAQDLRGVLEAMDRFRQPEQRRVDHSFFGAMSYTDWMRWGYLHTDHHLRQFGR